MKKILDKDLLTLSLRSLLIVAAMLVMARIAIFSQIFAKQIIIQNKGSVF